MWKLVAFALAAVLAMPARAEAPPAERAKIESLIRSIENLKDAVFIRNGKAHDAKAAADHLRTKWKWQSRDIQTARDFIRLCATRSSQTGLPYVIRWKDGHEQKSADFLEAELTKLK